MATIDIPACPVMLTQAMAESQKDEPNWLKLADRMASDPSISAAALKLAR